MNRFLYSVCVLFLAAPAFAATGSGNGLQKDQPIEISSDKLDVFQDEHKAIFSGNVIAIQGTTNMRSLKMTVYYRQDDSKKTAKPAAAKSDDSAAQGISRIDAEGNVVFTTPTETARGDLAVYNADTDTIDLTGNNVTLTRDQNVLKGNHLIYNMATDRSVLTANGTPVQGANGTGTTTGSGRVHGLFVPQSKDKK